MSAKQFASALKLSWVTGDSCISLSKLKGAVKPTGTVRKLLTYNLIRRSRYQHKKYGNQIKRFIIKDKNKLFWWIAQFYITLSDVLAGLRELFPDKREKRCDWWFYLVWHGSVLGTDTSVSTAEGFSLIRELKPSVCARARVKTRLLTRKQQITWCNVTIM